MATALVRFSHQALQSTAARATQQFCPRGSEFRRSHDRFSCGYPSKYLTFAVAEFDILLGRAIEPLDVSERVECHQMQRWFVTVQYLTFISAHPDTADIPGRAGDRNDKSSSNTGVACAMDHLQSGRGSRSGS